jgi:hypothetical protein
MLVVALHVAVEVVHIHLHLAEVAVGELADLEIDQNITAQQPIVENEVHEEVVLAEGEALLPSLEEKAFAEFEEEVLELAYDCGLEVALGVGGLFLQTEKLQDAGILEQVRGAANGVPVQRQPVDAILVPAQGEAFVAAGTRLALELGERPPGLGGFDLVEAALAVVANTEEEDVV